jgi:hypothetical protein
MHILLILYIRVFVVSALILLYILWHTKLQFSLLTHSFSYLQDVWNFLMLLTISLDFCPQLLMIHQLSYRIEKNTWKMLGPWHSWGRQKVPRLAPKLDPLIYDCLFLPAWLFLGLQNNSGTYSYSTSQACRPIPSGGHR